MTIGHYIHQYLFIKMMLKHHLEILRIIMKSNIPRKLIVLMLMLSPVLFLTACAQNQINSNLTNNSTKVVAVNQLAQQNKALVTDFY